VPERSQQVHNPRDRRGRVFLGQGFPEFHGQVFAADGEQAGVRNLREPVVVKVAADALGALDELGLLGRVREALGRVL
jgi:hypothetical protein